MAGTTLGSAYVQIVPTTKGIKGSISNLLNGEATSAGASAGSKLGASIKGALAKVAIGTAIVGTVKSAISEGAKLQQSYLGGLDTLYGEAAESARSYAREAAAAGISMNSYSEQAVSFGAALKSAYGGDVKKAAEAANTAILDMADNSAKMGTDIESVQMAYQGFAKGQYQLLDNLKLGYGGTKTEMQRLLDDAEKISGVKYDISNLGDVYDAIHVIQGDLGLTGVAAAEASETFSGSFNAMKASAQNLLGSLALGENVAPAMEGLISSISTFVFKNLIPMVGQVFRSLPSALVAFIRQGIPAMLSGISGLVGNIATYVSGLANSLTSEKVSAWASTTLPKILATGVKLIGGFAQSLIKSLPKVVVAISKIGLAIIKGLGSALWGKVTAAANGIKDRFMKPINTLKDKVKGIIDKIKAFFHFSVPTPHVPLPHFSISPAGWKISDLLKGTKPSLSVRWFAEGGIVDSPTLFGAGEAGAEAIVPLKTLWSELDKIADATALNTGNVTINVYARENQSPKQIAEEAVKLLISKENRRRLAWQ